MSESESDSTTKATDKEEKVEEKNPNVLENSDETNDVILEVEGRELHANRAVLAHYSPVFQRMFFSDFKEKSEARIPLPGKSYDDMVLFFNTLFLREPTSNSQISDENLLLLLALADEYQANEVKSKCQDYIRDKLFLYFNKFHSFYTNTNRKNDTFRYPLIGLYAAKGQSQKRIKLINDLSLYVRAYAVHDLPRDTHILDSLLVHLCEHYAELHNSDHYKHIPDAAKVRLLQLMCQKFDK